MSKTFDPPLAVGDSVEIIERRSGIVKEINGGMAIVTMPQTTYGGALVDHFIPIALAAEGKDWERKK